MKKIPPLKFEVKSKKHPKSVYVYISQEDIDLAFLDEEDVLIDFRIVDKQKFLAMCTKARRGIRRAFSAQYLEVYRATITLPDWEDLRFKYVHTHEQLRLFDGKDVDPIMFP